MTPQEQNQRSFDMAATALVKQGKPSGAPEEGDEDGGFQCLYRGPDGTRCAAGWLFEGEAGKDFTEGYRCTEGGVCDLLSANGHDPNFVNALQAAHDSPAGEPDLDWPSVWDWLSVWAADMRDIARRYDLSTAALDAALAARDKGLRG